MGIPFNDQWRLPRWDEGRAGAAVPGPEQQGEAGRRTWLAEQALRERLANAAAWRMLTRRLYGQQGEAGGRH